MPEPFESAPPQEDVKSREKKEFDKRMDVFFNEIDIWKKEVEGMKEYAEKNLEQAKKRPGMKYDCNIYRTPDGQIWSMFGSGYRLRGDESKKEVGTLPEGSVRANFDHSDEWAWESLKDVNARLPSWWRPETEDDMLYWERSASQDQISIDFAENLAGRREEIEKWAEVRAFNSDRQYLFVYQDDWMQLMDFLKISHKDQEKLFDATAVKLKLAESIDAVAGQEVERNIGY